MITLTTTIANITGEAFNISPTASELTPLQLLTPDTEALHRYQQTGNQAEFEFDYRQMLKKKLNFLSVWYKRLSPDKNITLVADSNPQYLHLVREAIAFHRPDCIDAVGEDLKNITSTIVPPTISSLPLLPTTKIKKVITTPVVVPTFDINSDGWLDVDFEDEGLSEVEEEPEVRKKYDNVIELPTIIKALSDVKEDNLINYIGQPVEVVSGITGKFKFSGVVTGTDWLNGVAIMDTSSGEKKAYFYECNLDVEVVAIAA